MYASKQRAPDPAVVYLDSILEELHKAVGKLEGTPAYDRIFLLQSLHGVGFLSAVVLITEMDSFDLFPSPKTLFMPTLASTLL